MPVLQANIPVTLISRAHVASPIPVAFPGSCSTFEPWPHLSIETALFPGNWVSSTRGAISPLRRCSASQPNSKSEFYNAVHGPEASTHGIGISLKLAD
jgi:hypothetical protein